MDDDLLTTLLIRDVSEAATDVALSQVDLFQMHMAEALRRVAPYVDYDDPGLGSPVQGDDGKDLTLSAGCLSDALVALTLRYSPSTVFLLLLEALGWSHAGRDQRTAREWLTFYRLRVR